ncbi:MAG: hypothetical protein RIM84_23020 [Alphaproteobacteria bacterium]
MSDEATAEVFRRLPDLVNGDAALVRRGQWLTGCIRIDCGAVPVFVSVEAGRIAAVEVGPRLLRSVLFSIAAPADAWRRFWEPVPVAGFHDLFAMTKAGVATVDGHLEPLMASLRYVKEVLAAPRGRDA